MGEDIGHFVFQYIKYLFNATWGLITLLTARTQLMLMSLWSFMQDNRLKVLLALILTIPITWWLIQWRTNGQNEHKLNPKRGIAIGLAALLGWLGAHRFYLNQIGWGVAFLLCCYLFPPLALMIGWIDALRFLLMDNTEFNHLYNSHSEKQIKENNPEDH